MYLYTYNHIYTFISITLIMNIISRAFRSSTMAVPRLSETFWHLGPNIIIISSSSSSSSSIMIISRIMITIVV